MISFYIWLNKRKVECPSPYKFDESFIAFIANGLVQKRMINSKSVAECVPFSQCLSLCMFFFNIKTGLVFKWDCSTGACLIRKKRHEIPFWHVITTWSGVDGSALHTQRHSD